MSGISLIFRKSVFSNKKGTIAEDTMHIIFLFLSLSITAAMFVVLVSVDTGEKYKMNEDVEESILSQRLISSPSCFVYRDEVNRAYPGIIDLDKFNQQNLDECFRLDSVNYAFRISLVSETLDQRIELSTSNWNKSSQEINQRPVIKVLLIDDDPSSPAEGKFIIEVKSVTVNLDTTEGYFEAK